MNLETRLVYNSLKYDAEKKVAAARRAYPNDPTPSLVRALKRFLNANIPSIPSDLCRSLIKAALKNVDWKAIALAFLNMDSNDFRNILHNDDDDDDDEF